MAKVSQGLSFTFRIGPDNKNQYAKISIEVSDIDTEIPFEKVKPEDTLVGKAQIAHKSVKKLHLLLSRIDLENPNLEDLPSIYGEPESVIAILEDITKRANLLYERKRGELNE